MRKRVNIFEAAIDAKKVVYLILLALVAVGIFGVLKMNKDEFPTVEIKDGLVAGIYPGASAEDVERELTKPLEEVLLSCPDVDRNKIRSISKDGICYIYVTLTAPAEKLRQTWSDIRFKFQTRKLTLPLNVLAVVVLDDFSSISSILVSLESDDKGWSEMSDYARDLKERLLAVEDVAKVTVLGEQSEEIAVTADVDRLASYGLSPALLNLRYTSEGLKLPSGSFSTDYIQAPIYIQESISSEEEVSKQIIFSDPQAGVIRLEDVATVERRVKDKTSTIKYNGCNTLLLSVTMRSNKDIVAFGGKVNKVIKAFEEELPDSVHLTRVTDQPKVVKTSVLNFIRDLVISVLVVIFVMLVLFPFNCAIVASTSVPACTAIAIALMFLFGMPLNTVTLAGLIVVLGMIVDDSIVTMDGYMDKLRSGMSRREAAVASSKELCMPMFMATLSISLMLFPMLFIVKGHLGDVFGMFPWVIAMALMTSLAYALFVIPSMEIKFIAGPSEVRKESKFARLQNKFFIGLQNIYEKGERACFKAPKLTILAAVLLVAAGLFIFTKLSVQLLPSASRDMFVVEMTMEPGSGIDDTQKVADSLSVMMRRDPRVKNITTFAGSSAPRFHATYAPSLPSPEFAQLIVNTTSERATEELVAEYEEKYEYWFTNALVRVKQMDYQGVSAPVEIRISSKERERTYAFGDSLAAFMRSQNDLLKWVCTDYPMIPGVMVNLDKEEASRLEVNPAALALSLYQDFSSSSLMSYSEGNDDRVSVTLYSSSAADTATFDAISNKVVRGAAPGVRVPLRQIASVDPVWVPSQIIRTKGLDETISVAADIKSGRSYPQAMKRIRTWIADHSGLLPAGAVIEEDGLTRVNREYAPMLIGSFVAALIVMFVFLLIHFKKISIAVLTMTLSLLCLFGSFLGLYVFEQDFSMTALLGLISLIGIIVRNGIIMFEYAEELHYEEGLSYKEAAMLAGARRMRPIFLTSCAASLGVLPMIISGDALWMPMGVVICFGVILTLPFIVLVMPISYWQLFAKKDKQNEEK